MMNILSVLKRFGRVAVAVVLAGIPTYFANDPKYLILAPVISAVGKWLRAVLGLKYVPF